MVSDCFSVFNELDLLEIRLNVLWNVVDKFVFTEATMTHTGKPKPLYYEESKARFAKYADKIIHIVVDDFPEPPDYYTPQQVTWMREDWQRNAVKRALKGVAGPDDLIMISDVDEIPSPEAVHRCIDNDGVTVFEQLLSNYYLNFVSYTTPVWRGTKAAKYKVFCDPDTYAKMKPSKYVDEVTNRGATASRLRHVHPDHRIKKAGWHFSYLGGAKEIVRKIGSIAVEYSNANNNSEQWVADVIEKGLDINHCGRRFFIVPLDERFPEYLLKNRDKYAALILNGNVDYYRRTRKDRIVCAIRGWIRKNGAKLIPRPFKQFLYDKVYCKLVKEPIVM